MELGERILETVKRHPEAIQGYEDYFSYCRELGDGKGLPLARAFRISIREGVSRALGRRDALLATQLDGVYFRTLVWGARSCFDDYLTAVEYGRKPDKQFYLPRRCYLKRYVDAYQRVLDGELDVISISMPKRTGKAVTFDTLIPTPNGFVKMGDIKVGDKVFASDGTATTVTEVFPQGEVPVYEVKFSDGAVVKTCGEHLWKVKYHNVNTPSRRNGYSEKVMSTRELLDFGLQGGNGRNRHNIFAVDFCKPVEFKKRKQSLDPYVLGVLLGDGTLRDQTIMFTTLDHEVSDYVMNHVPDGDICYCQDEKKGRWLIRSRDRKFDSHGHLLKSSTCSMLKEMGLIGLLSYDKHVPENYLLTDSQSRLELLGGLLDTDGYCDGQQIEYATTSPRLRDAVLFLVRSLGGKATWSERMGEYKKNGEIVNTRINYRVHICFPSGVNPFKIARKRDRYMPKREKLYHYIESITPCGTEKAQCIRVSHADHLFLITDYFVPTHNSQTGINFVMMVSGLHPDGSTLMEGTGDALVKSFYNGCLEYLSPPYRFSEIFPSSPLVQTDADKKVINLEGRSRFPTIMCRSIDATQVGLSEATNLLYLDDCVEGYEEAKNRERLEEKWRVISGDVIGRAIEGTPVVICGTRYSIYDPIGKMQDYARSEGLRMEVLETPALDFDTDESNFEHVREGRKVFTTKWFRAQRALVSEEQWESEFQQSPIEARGTLFPRQKLQYFKEIPPMEPDAVLAVCDTAESGEDSTAMPVGYLYGTEVYIVDVVFDNSPSIVTKPECASKIKEHKVMSCTFESNNAGEYFGRDVQRELRLAGYPYCAIRHKRTLSNKHTRIEIASDTILKHFHFWHPSTYEHGKQQYSRFMREVWGYVRTASKKKHDDAPDSLALFVDDLRRRGMYARTEAVSRPF